MSQEFRLKRFGERPVEIQGKLLLEMSAQSGQIWCRFWVIETQDGYVGQISLRLEMDQGHLSFVQIADDPQSLRDWFARFDPAAAISVSGLLAPLDESPVPSPAALAAAGRAISSCLDQVRWTYDRVLKGAFGISSHQKLAA